MIYQWGTHKHAADPQEVGERIEQVAKRRDGVADTGALLDDARDPQSPLHPLPEWDDYRAAEAFRRWQIRDAVASLIVVVEDSEGRERNSPAFYNVNVTVGEGEQAEKRRGYQPVSVVSSHEESRRSAAHELLGQLRGLQSRFDALEEFEPVWRAIDEVEQNVDTE